MMVPKDLADMGGDLGVSGGSLGRGELGSPTRANFPGRRPSSGDCGGVGLDMPKIDKPDGFDCLLL